MGALIVEPVQALFDMGDHAPYVWSAWGIALVIIVVMACAPVLRWRAFKRQAVATRELTAESEEFEEAP